MGKKFGKIFKSVIPALAAAGGNMLVPGLGSVAGPLIGGMITGKGSKDNAKKVFEDVNKVSHANQANAQGDTSTWTQDPSGQWSQTQKYSPERQKQLDLFNQMATGRMAMAAGLDPTGKSYQGDYEKMGLGALLGGDTGTTGKRPWADDKYSSLGGDALKYLQFAGPGPDIPYTQTWGATPMKTQQPQPMQNAPGPQPQMQDMMLRGGGPPPMPPAGAAAGGDMLRRMAPPQPGTGY